MKKFEFKAVGLHCNNCVKRVHAILSEHYGENETKVQLLPPKVTISSMEKPQLNDLNKLLSDYGDYQLESI